MAMLRFHTRSFPTRSCHGQICAELPHLKPLDRLPHRSHNSRAELMEKMRALFGIVGVFVGAYVYSPSVMAEGEEVSSQDESIYGSDLPTTISGIADHTINIEDDPASDLSSIDHYHINNIHIPDAVWNLDVSTDVHLGRISGGSDAATYAAFGARLKRADFWSQITLGLWNNNIANTGQNLLIPPALFQVASCGGNSPEHSNLDYCNGDDVNVDKIDGNSNNNERNKNDPATQGVDNSMINSINTSNAPSLNLSTSPNIGPLMPSQFFMSRDLTVVGQCDGVSIFCAPIGVELPAGLVDASQPPVDDLTPPVDDLTPPVGDLTPRVGDLTPPVGDQTPPVNLSPPGIDSSGLGVGDPGSDPGRPIPEAPTWVMTTIGFGIFAFVFRKKKINHVKSISIIDNAEID
jgi:hypothetical protein